MASISCWENSDLLFPSMPRRASLKKKHIYQTKFSFTMRMSSSAVYVQDLTCFISLCLLLQCLSSSKLKVRGLSECVAQCNKVSPSLERKGLHFLDRLVIICLGTNFACRRMNICIVAQTSKHDACTNTNFPGKARVNRRSNFT